MKFSKAVVLVAALVGASQQVVIAQGNDLNYGSGINTIVTAVPFLRITPDARFGALGDAGVSLSPDPNSMHFNQSALAFTEDDFGISATYNPWLKNLGLNDVYLAYLSAYKKIDKLQTIGFGLRYFSLGNIQFTDYNGQSLGSDRPNEFEITLAYARQLGKNFSAGLGIKYIYSKLANGTYNGNNIKPGSAVAADLSFMYRKPLKFGNGKRGTLRVGGQLSNLGTKISYTQSANKDFIPTNLGLGVSMEYEFDEHNSITGAAEVNRLLVPTPQRRYLQNWKGADSVVVNTTTRVEDPNYDANNNDVPDFKETSVVGSIFSSWADAPGGFKEEMSEFNVSLAAEYWYNKQFAVRAGYFYEPATKGNRHYLTLGLGLKYSVFGLNFAYLVPTSNNRNPLDNTLRFSLLFNFGKEEEAALEEE